MRKIVLTERKGVMVLVDCEIEKDLDGDHKTVKVYGERTATPEEVLLYQTGFGRFIKFQPGRQNHERKEGGADGK